MILCAPEDALCAQDLERLVTCAPKTFYVLCGGLVQSLVRGLVRRPSAEVDGPPRAQEEKSC